MERAYTHNGTGRVIEVLEVVSSFDEGLTFMEISNKLNVPKSTLVPILKTLKQSGFLGYNEMTSRYTIGIRVYELSRRYIKSRGYLSFVKERLSEIVDACGETCYYGVLIGGEVLYLMNVDSPQAVRMVAVVGKRLMAYSTAIGKALLSQHESLAQIKALYPQGLNPITEHTVTDFNQLFKQLEAVKKTGFAYEFEESSEHIACIATPIYKDGRMVSALSIATPTFRKDADKDAYQMELLSSYRKRIEDFIEHLSDQDVEIT